jgi:hypothetical protein
MLQRGLDLDGFFGMENLYEMWNMECWEITRGQVHYKQQQVNYLSYI